MAVGTPIVSCTTQPVLEVLTHNRNSLLSDFFDIDSIVANVEELLDNPAKSAKLSHLAQIDSERFSCTHSLDRWQSLLH